MFAVQAGAKNVYGCEMSKTMYEVSHDVVSANHMEDKIHLIHKLSTDLEIPQDLPQWLVLLTFWNVWPFTPIMLMYPSIPTSTF